MDELDEKDKFGISLFPSHFPTINEGPELKEERG